MLEKIKQDIESRKEKLGNSIYYLHEVGSDAFVLYFLKINFIHAFFEVLFAVLYINLMIFYSPLFNADSTRTIPISEFFGGVLFSCGIYYLIIVVFYFFIVIMIAMHYIIKGEDSEKSSKDSDTEPENPKTNLRNIYKKAIQRSIILGFLLHIVMGIISAAYPSFFTGKALSLDIYNRYEIGLAIILFGLGGHLLSWLRLNRINWCDAIKNRVYGDVDEYNQYSNTLFYTLISGIAQVIATCIIIILFAKMFMNLNHGYGDFDYYNLMLAIVFAVISTYITVVYKNEFFGHKMPGYSIKPCKKTIEDKNDNIFSHNSTGD